MHPPTPSHGEGFCLVSEITLLRPREMKKENPFNFVSLRFQDLQLRFIPFPRHFNSVSQRFQSTAIIFYAASPPCSRVPEYRRIMIREKAFFSFFFGCERFQLPLLPFIVLCFFSSSPKNKKLDRRRTGRARKT